MASKKEKVDDGLSEPLTPREQDVLLLLAQHLRYQDIAEQLTMALSSVKWYANQIYGKLDVDNRRDAIQRAQELGLLQTPSPAAGSVPLPSGLVTFLFTDIQGSTPLWEQMPDAMEIAVTQHHRLLHQAIEANGGQVTQIIGDSFQAVFRLATGGLCAALAAQRSLDEATWGPTGPLKVRMGIHVGPAELDPLGNAPYAVSHTLNRAARIMSAGHGGQILLSQEASDLLAHELPEGVTLTDLGKYNLKGLRRPEALYQVVAPDLPNRFPPLRTEHRAEHNLPLELTPFIGRQAAIAEVQELLREHRLVTLTGSGGVGKTRLSIQVAARVLADMPDGVWYVELAPVTDPDLVPQTVAAVLGLREEPGQTLLETLGNFLSKRKLLLILDNSEHVLAACARLADALLRTAPKLQIFASSREAFGIAGEYAFRVPSLAVPDSSQAISLQELQDSEAVQLFMDRARAALPGFRLDEHNGADIAAICRRLDGIPLALELAAARLNLLTPGQLGGRLDHMFLLLTGGSRAALPRQQTLRATIDWSYRLLSHEEQVLLRRLAVFTGGGTLEAIEAICASDDLPAEHILDVLAGLVSKSMINPERKQMPNQAEEEIRYSLLETVRQYAREKLYDTEAIEGLRCRHLDYFVTFCETAQPHIQGAGRLEWTARLKRENNNIREALGWAFHDSTLALSGLRIVAALTFRFWQPAGLFTETSRWATAGLQAAGDAVPKLMRAKILLILRITLPREQAKTAGEQCVALCREIGPQADRVLCMALSYSFDDDYKQSLARVEEALQIARGLGPAGNFELGETLFYYMGTLYQHPQGAYDDQLLAAVEEFQQVHEVGDRWHPGGYWIIGFIKTLRGQAQQAQQAFEMGLKLSKEVEDYLGIESSLFFLIWFHRLAGHYAQALSYCREFYAFIYSVAYENGYPLFLHSTGFLLVNYANDALSDGDSQAGLDAVRIVSFVSKIVGENDWPWYERFKSVDLQALERLRHELGKENFSKAWKEGQDMTLNEAVAMASAVEIKTER